MSTITTNSSSPNNVMLLAAAGTLATLIVGAVGWRTVVSTTTSNTTTTTTTKSDDASLKKEREEEGIIPTVPSSSWIPLLGSTAEYFSSIVCFMDKYFRLYNGKPFQAKILGRSWYFVIDPMDARKVLRTTERAGISMYRGIDVVAGRMLPTEAVDGKNAPDQVKALFRNNGTPSTKVFIHALKHLPNWIPQLREAFQYNFSNYLEQDGGEKELFDWCLDLISLATSRVMMGPNIDIEIVKEWMQLVKDCDIEIAIQGQGMVGAVTNFALIAMTGERPIYRKARKFTYPYIEMEIENYLKGRPENGSVICSLVRAVGKHLNGKENPNLLNEAKVKIANDLILFTFAAITNSYGCAAWALYHILKDTEGCGTKIRSEIDVVKKTTTTQSSSEMSDDGAVVSETLELTIFEILRLYTPGNFFRYVQSSFRLDSDPTKVIPGGSMVAFNAALLSRRPDAYPDPFKFDPYRFDPSSSQYNKTSDENFFGFGFGAHPCVGKRFALSEISLFVAEALNTFDFELLEEEQVEPSSSSYAAKADKDKMAMDFTKRMIHNVPNHPILDPSQTNSIWRAKNPVMIRYKRKTMI